MSVKSIEPGKTELAGILHSAREEPVILRSGETGDYVVLPLDEEVVDLLLERNPALIEECRQIRETMRRGSYVTHEQLLESLANDQS
jgi:hypothetical protein